MASLVLTDIFRALLQAEVDFNVDDLVVALLMSNTTCDTEEEVLSVSAYTDIDEMDGANYSRFILVYTVTTRIVKDSALDEAYFDADDWLSTALGVGARNVTGVLLYKKIGAGSFGADATNKPIAFIDLADFAANGGDVTIQWAATGLVKIS